MIIERRHYSDESADNSLLKCKIAIITGGAQGIGFHIADKILAAGAKTVILGDVLVEACEKATTKLNKKYGGEKALFHQCDVSKKEDVEKLFKATKDKLGQLDLVVNNAGILADSKWEQTIAINAVGLVRGTLLGFKYMGVNNGGKGGYIINVASILGLQPLYSTPIYVGTKHFVVGFSRSMGAEYYYNLTKVKVMAVCPGVTDTALIHDSSKGVLQGFDDLARELTCNLRSLSSQGADKVGDAVIEMIKASENGSVWVSEGCKTYKADLPDRSSFIPCPWKKKKDDKTKKKDPCEKEGPCKKDLFKCKPDPCKKNPGC